MKNRDSLSELPPHLFQPVNAPHVVPSRKLPQQVLPERAVPHESDPEPPPPLDVVAREPPEPRVRRRVRPLARRAERCHLVDHGPHEPRSGRVQSQHAAVVALLPQVTQGVPDAVVKRRREDVEVEALP